MQFCGKEKEYILCEWGKRMSSKIHHFHTIVNRSNRKWIFIFKKFIQNTMILNAPKKVLYRGEKVYRKEIDLLYIYMN